MRGRSCSDSHEGHDFSDDSNNRHLQPNFGEPYGNIHGAIRGNKRGNKHDTLRARSIAIAPPAA
jgi:hypothetical protein